jgi:hypothetical protein
MATDTTDKPVRVGVFDKVASASQAVNNLLAAGFTKEELGVLCSDKYKAQFFQDIPKPTMGGKYTPEATVAGGVIGAAIGGLMLAATALTAGGALLLASGTVLVGGGAIAGTFVGAMSTRGVTKEVADFYDQAVQRGKILVAVEVHGEGKESRLAQAERILAEAGSEPVPLVEG